jgi:hypothetical protein
VSSASQEIEKTATAGVVARLVDPFRNPSYPQRTHFHEREQLEESLHGVEVRLDAARGKLNAESAHAQDSERLRLYHQMLGARDQIAECVNRLPLEAAELYVEDKERYEQAVAAFERLWRKWERTGG